MAEPAHATMPAHAFESEVQDVLALCQGNALNALRVVLIANAFLEAEIDRLKPVLSPAATLSRSAWRSSVGPGKI